MNEQLQCLLQKLDEPAHRYAELDRYYRGTQPLAFLSPEAKTALGNRFGRMASNIPRLAVTALAERLPITGFTGDTELWAEWIRNDLDQISGVAHREALLLGDSFAIVWADQFGRPTVTVESAKQVAVQIDPGTRQITAAVKRWETKTTTEAVLYKRTGSPATGPTRPAFAACFGGSTSVGLTIPEHFGTAPPQIRALSKLGATYLEGYGQGGFGTLDVEFRQGGSAIFRPYTSLRFDKSALVEVVLGPNLQLRSIESTVRRLLNRYGFRHTKISRSTSSYRG